MTSVDLSSITDSHYDITAGALNHDSCGALSQTIHGRNTEMILLLEAYQRLLQTKCAQTIVVHGESGSGKTALVDTLRDRLGNSDIPGYFVAGKFFQKSDSDGDGGAMQEPHSAITAAFSDLCDLIAQSEGFEERQKIIEQQLGFDACLLSKSISNMAPFVGDVKEAEAAFVQASSVAKFKLACKTFLRAMACDDHPVVVFLDDLQWADEGSNHLIKGFLDDSELKNVMFILAYRDEETSQILQNVLAHARSPVDIPLSNLDAEAVHQIVCDIAGSSSNGVRALSALVAKRTAGNPFHLVMLMDAIQQDGLLFFNSSTGSSIFDVKQIQMAVMASETLTDLLERKIEQLDDEITETLKAASLLGYHFDESILLEVACLRTMQREYSIDRDSPDDQVLHTVRSNVIAALVSAVREGFIERTADGYQFTHDKLQAAFRQLVDRPEEDQLNLLIGQTFLCDTNDKSRMYKAAVHLNHAPEFIHSQERQTELARINLEAAKYCAGKSAFIKAVSMLQSGLAALDPDERWSAKNFDLTYEMMESLAKTQVIVGDFQGCKETTKEALDHSRTVEMKICFLLIDVEVQMVGIEVEKAVTSAFAALRTLGVSTPRKIKARHVAVKLVKVRWMMRRTSDEKLTNLPFTEDPLATSAIKLLMHICIYCLVKNEVSACLYSALLAMELTLQSGLLSPHSSSALVLYGFIEVALGNVDRAYNYGKIALIMLERMTSKESECTTITYAMTMLTFWKDPFDQLINPLKQAAELGFQRGDVLFASHCLSQYFHLHLNVGTNLAIMEASMREKYGMVSDLCQDGMLLWFQPALQYLINLQCNASCWEHLAVLTGEFMNEEEYIRDAEKADHLLLVMTAAVWKVAIACDFEQYAIAVEMYEKTKAFDQGIRFSFQGPMYFWNAARASYGRYNQTGKRRYLKKGRKYQKLLEKLASAGSVHAAPLVAFLVAQESGQRKNITDESALHEVYDRGIQCLAKQNLLHYEGLLNEKAGFEFTKRGWHAAAEAYFQRALRIYRRDWGAIAKCSWLQQQCLIRQPSTFNASGGIPHGITVDRQSSGE